jgi:hypothetical protein
VLVDGAGFISGSTPTLVDQGSIVSITATPSFSKRNAERHLTFKRVLFCVRA